MFVRVFGEVEEKSSVPGDERKLGNARKTDFTARKDPEKLPIR